MHGAYHKSPVDILAIVEAQWPVLSPQVNAVRKAMSEFSIRLISASITGVILRLNKEKIDESINMYGSIINIHFDNHQMYSIFHKSNFNDEYFIAVGFQR